MGLKTTNYEIKSLHITLPEAYCLLDNIQFERDRSVICARIQQSRETTFNAEPMERVFVSYPININKPLGEQAYQALKEQLGERWIDDII